MIVSAAERTILDALVISPHLPAIQARAQVVLRAAEGLEDDSIAAELSMRRKDVLHWRKRFEAQGIRGLWDPPGPGPKKRVSPEKERALLWEVLYAVPVLYPPERVPQALRPLMDLNPIAHLVDMFRAAIIGTHPPDLLALGVIGVGGMLVLVVAQRVFSVFDGILADVI